MQENMIQTCQKLMPMAISQKMKKQILQVQLIKLKNYQCQGKNVKLKSCFLTKFSLANVP